MRSGLPRCLWPSLLRPGELYAGLEAVALWISRDSGEHWEELTALRGHPAAAQWHFFEPMKPHVRAMAFDQRGERLYIGIEEGGVLVSRDGGRSFEDRSHGVDADVHAIQVAPGRPDLLFAMTGGGLFRSQDGGQQWERLTAGLDRWYLIPLIVVSSRVLCVGAGNTPPPAWRTRGADAAIYRSQDGGTTWRLATGPFPLRGMLSAMAAVPGHPDRVFASTTDGVLLRSWDGGQHWTMAAEHLPKIEEMVIIGWSAPPSVG